MESITIGQIAVAVALAAGLVTGLGVLGKQISKAMKKIVEKDLKSLDAKVDELGQRISSVDLEATKNYLVGFLGDLEAGKEPREIELQRFWEQYQHYTSRGGNSYIRRKVEQFESEGKL